MCVCVFPACFAVPGPGVCGLPRDRGSAERGADGDVQVTPLFISLHTAGKDWWVWSCDGRGPVRRQVHGILLIKH